MKKIPVKNSKHLYRDEDSNAIVNTNFEEYNNYISIRNKRENDKNKITSIQNEINDMKSDLEEIKSLLKSIVK